MGLKVEGMWHGKCYLILGRHLVLTLTFCKIMGIHTGRLWPLKYNTIREDAELRHAFLMPRLYRHKMLISAPQNLPYSVCDRPRIGSVSQM